MKIEFKIGATAATFTRGSFFGGMKIVTPNESIWLQHPLNLSTHFSFHTTDSWQEVIDGQDVLVTKVRPLLVAGLRPQTYMIYVNGNLVASSQGY